MRVMRVIAKVIYLPHLLLRDYALLGHWSSIKAIVRWLKETRTEQEIEFDTQMDIYSKVK